MNHVMGVMKARSKDIIFLILDQTSQDSTSERESVCVFDADTV